MVHTHRQPIPRCDNVTLHLHPQLSAITLVRLVPDKDQEKIRVSHAVRHAAATCQCANVPMCQCGVAGASNCLCVAQVDINYMTTNRLQHFNVGLFFWRVLL
jgi:hypothetical protein